MERHYAWIDKLILITLIVMVGLVPLLVLAKSVPIPEEIMSFWNGWTDETYHLNLYSYYKSRVLLVCGGILAIFILFNLKSFYKQIRFTWLWAFLLGAFLFILLATIFSQYSAVAVNGLPNRCEGLLVWLSYLVLLLAMVIFVRNTRQLSYLVGSLLISAGLISIIGLFQYYGMDVLVSVRGQGIITALDSLSSSGLESKLDDYSLASTLYNPNNAGMYFSMLFPFAVVIFLAADSFKKRIIMLGLSCLFFAALLGSNARGAFFATIVAIVVLCIMAQYLLKKNRTAVLFLVLALLLVILVMDRTSNGKVTGRMGSIPDSVTMVSPEEIWRPLTSEPGIIAGIYNKKLQIKFDDNRVYINSGDDSLIIETLNGKIQFLDPMFNALQIRRLDNGIWFFNDPRYANIFFNFKKNNLDLYFNDTKVSLRVLDNHCFFNQEVTAPIQELKSDKNSLIVDNGKDSFAIRVKSKQISCVSEDGSLIPLIPWKDNHFLIADSRFADYYIAFTDDYLRLYKGRLFLTFTANDCGFRYQKVSGQPYDIGQPVETFGFAGRESFFSGRGYIWSRSIPLLKDTILLGYGPDNYLIYFPQHDSLGKFLYLYDQNMLVDKPHNIYLQLGINFGLVSLLLFLLFWSTYLIKSYRRYHGLKNLTASQAVGIACMVAVIAYLISGLVYDSNVSVSPVFWGLLGIGIACNNFKEVRVEDTPPQCPEDITSDENGMSNL
jgi:hypothetical protein